eukprot:GHVO01052348.1.p1 GENE.GHVO01052348.1~~GHVO01052348.1.p1  ORF type:complete len:619 (-),score=87.25 GHVO01052348.1:10-1866(-)
MLSTEDRQWVEEIGQSHLFHSEMDHEQAQKLASQLKDLNGVYPGGLAQYVQRAKALLCDSKNSVNPFEGFTVSVPQGEVLQVGSQTFDVMESVGIGELPHTAFCLVAGGLGERLGCADTKVNIPTEITTGQTYLQLYCKYIQAFQARCVRTTGKAVLIPLAIMTSDDTDERTRVLLANNKYYGLDKAQVTIVKQDKVPAVVDDKGRFALKSCSAAIETKPHGHGDVHTLLYTAGLVEKWHTEGKKWIVFFQDTNSLVPRAFPSVLGVSQSRGLAMNHVAVPRKPGEPVGSICRITNKDKQLSMTCNVEYNQLIPLLQATGLTGDLPDENGVSQYPGNTNVLVFNIPPYLAALNEGGGAVPEFVNPKYVDDTKTTFKAPARLECMMQDFARVFKEPEQLVGFTQLDRWFCFSTLKNNNKDGGAKSAHGLPPETSFSAESDLYYQSSKLLAIAAADRGCEALIASPRPMEYSGVKYNMGPRVLLMPAFALTLADIRQHLAPASKLEITHRSTLVVDGPIDFNNLILDGALLVSTGHCENAADETYTGRSIIIKNLKVTNDSYTLYGCDDSDVIASRGYKIDRDGWATEIRCCPYNAPHTEKKKKNKTQKKKKKKKKSTLR